MMDVQDRAGIEPAGLARSLRGLPLIGDAEVLVDRATGETTVLLVRRGYRPGAVLRDLVMELTGDAGRDIRVAIVPMIPRGDDGTLDEAAAWAATEARALILRYEPPVTEAERSLAELIQEVLPDVRVSLTDDLACLGGDSLFAVELVGLIAERWGVQMDAQDLFAAESVRDMAAVLAQVLDGRS